MNIYTTKCETCDQEEEFISTSEIVICGKCGSRTTTTNISAYIHERTEKDSIAAPSLDIGYARRGFKRN